MKSIAPVCPGFFVTATDTGVGKTLVTALLVRRLREQGVMAFPMKPVQTGCARAQTGRNTAPVLSAPDLEFCLNRNGLTLDATDRDCLAPFRFVKACSPHLAARLARKHISVRVVCQAVQRAALRFGCLVVEGAGGVLVPLKKSETLLDLMKALRLPVILVARAGLGSINHTLLSLTVLRQQGLTVSGVVINRAVPGRGDITVERDTINAIRAFGNTPILGNLPFRPLAIRSQASWHALARNLGLPLAV